MALHLSLNRKPRSIRVLRSKIFNMRKYIAPILWSFGFVLLISGWIYMEKQAVPHGCYDHGKKVDCSTFVRKNEYKK